MKIAGFPLDIIQLLHSWLSDREFYIEINNVRSILKRNDHGTIQGTVLGPILYSIFVRPIFDLLDLTTFADDNYVLERDKDVLSTIGKVKFKSEYFLNWLKKSGLKINADKTEICIFANNDIQPCDVYILNKKIVTKNSLKVLGLIFDSKLTWHLQINESITKAKKLLQAIKLLSRYFNKKKLIEISTVFFYSKLYNGCQVWLMPTLNSKLKHKILQASASCLRVCCKDYLKFFSFNELHILCNRALPHQWMTYTYLNLLHDIFNLQKPANMFETLKSKIVTRSYE